MRGTVTTDNKIFAKIIRQKGWAAQPDPYTAQHPAPPPLLQVGRSELAWAEAGVYPSGGNTGQEAKGSGTGRGPTQNLSSGQSVGASEAM